MLSLALLSLLAAPAVAQDAADAADTPRVRSYPHNTQKQRDPADPSCGVCHAEIPEEGAAPEAAKLRMPPAQSCQMCHRGPIHYGIDEHLGKVVPESQRASLPPEVALLEDGSIACFSCHEVHTLAFDEKVQQEIISWQPHRPLAMALRQRSLQRDWAASLAEAGDTLQLPPAHDPVVPPLLGLTVHDGALCEACHGQGP